MNERMRVLIEQADLQRACRVVKPFISARNTLPILHGVKLVNRGDILSVAATDLDMAIEANVSCPTLGNVDGETVVNFRHLSAAAQVFNGVSTITLEDRECLVNLSAAGTEIDLLPRDTADFPYIPSLNKDNLRLQLDVLAVDLKAALTAITRCASREETRSLLMGVMLRPVEGEVIELFATDTHRLGRARVPFLRVGSVITPQVGAQIIIPAAACNALVLALKHWGTGHVRIEADSDKVCFSWPDVKIISRLFDGKYPTVEKVLSPALIEPHWMRLIVGRQSFLNVLRAGLKLQPKAIKSTIKVDAKRLQMFFGERGLNGDEFRFRSVVPDVQLESVAGPVSVSFNPRYLLDAVTALPGEWFEWTAQESLLPSLFRPVAPGKPVEDSPLFLVMPMQVDRERDIWEPGA